MSTLSGLQAKGEKGKSSKYTSININNLYKGKSIEPQQKAVSTKHGLQSLGKVASVRRMPPPANLPSLKSENSGNDPNVNIVPSGSSGWGTKQETSSSPPLTQTAIQSAKQKEATPAATPTSLTRGLTSQSTVNQPQPSNGTVPIAIQPQVATSIPPNQNAGTGGSLQEGSKSWSSVTSNPPGEPRAPSFLQHQSPFFQQEFPKLAGGDSLKDASGNKSSEFQYGPGPSLRPQTEGSWTQGGGRSVVTQQAEMNHINGQSVPPPPPQSPGSSDIGGRVVPSLGPQGGPPMGVGPGGPQMPIPPLPGPGVPPHQFRAMLPPYMYRGNFPGGYPNYPAGMHGPHRHRYPYPDARMRPVLRQYSDEDGYTPHPIIKEEELKSLDKNDDRECWATNPGDIDYNKKLNFSDDEESLSERNEEMLADSKERKTAEKERDKEDSKDERRNWVDGNRGPPPQWQAGRLPYDYRQVNSMYPHGPPPSMRMMPPSSPMTYGPRIIDEDEVWREKKRQQSDDIEKVIERARKRREEEEIRYAQAEKLKVEERNTVKFRRSPDHDEEFRDDRQRSSDGKDEKGSRSYVNDRRALLPDPSYSAKQLQKLPPRLLKQHQESMRQNSRHSGDRWSGAPHQQKQTSRYNADDNCDKVEYKDDLDHESQFEFDRIQLDKEWEGSVSHGYEKSRSESRKCSTPSSDTRNGPTVQKDPFDESLEAFEIVDNGVENKRDVDPSYKYSKLREKERKYIDHDIKERPQRPDSRDSHASRESRGSKDSEFRNKKHTRFEKEYSPTWVEKGTGSQDKEATEKLMKSDKTKAERHGHVHISAPTPITREKLEAAEQKVKSGVSHFTSLKRLGQQEKRTEFKKESQIYDDKAAKKDNKPAVTSSDNVWSCKANLIEDVKGLNWANNFDQRGSAGIVKPLEKDESSGKELKDAPRDKFDKDRKDEKRAVRDKRERTDRRDKNEWHSSKIKYDRGRLGVVRGRGHPTYRGRGRNEYPKEDKKFMSTDRFGQYDSYSDNEDSLKEPGSKLKTDIRKDLRAKKYQKYDKTRDIKKEEGRGERMNDRKSYEAIPYSFGRGMYNSRSDLGRRGRGATSRGYPSRRYENSSYVSKSYSTHTKKEEIRVSEGSHKGELQDGSLEFKDAYKKDFLDDGEGVSKKHRIDRIAPRFQRKIEYERGGPKLGRSLVKQKTVKSQFANTAEGLNENDDWETASESSDVGEKNKESKSEKELKDKNSGSKKSFQSQRPADRQNRRYPGPGGAGASGKSLKDSKTGTGTHASKDKAGASGKGGSSGTGKSNVGTRREGSRPEEAMVDSQVAPCDKNRPGRPDKSALDGIDLNNYASVVIVDDQPEVDQPSATESNEGFQEVLSKRSAKERQKALLEEEAKRLKKDEKIKGKKSKKTAKSGLDRSRQNKLPPRLAKQRENVRMNLQKSLSNDDSLTSNSLDTAPAPPPPVNAWDKPIAQTFRGTSDLRDPSDLEKSLDGSTPPMQTVIFENTNYKNGSQDTLMGKKYGTGVAKVQRQDSKRSDRKDINSLSNNELFTKERGSSGVEKKVPSIELPLSYKADDSQDMKLDFTFEPGLSVLDSEEKVPETGKMPLGRNIQLSTPSPISPSDAELNKKIASVKAVWETNPVLPTVIEHGVPSAPNGDEIKVGVSQQSSLGFSEKHTYTTSLDGSNKAAQETQSSEINYSCAGSLQHSSSGSGLSKAISSSEMAMSCSSSSNVCKVKPQQVLAPSTPPPVNLTTLGSNVFPPPAGVSATAIQYGGLSTIPSPPTQTAVLFNSSQQVPTQTGICQSFQIDGSQVIGTQGRPSQYSQPPYGHAAYSLSQQNAGPNTPGNNYGQQSVILHNTTAPDLYRFQYGQTHGSLGSSSSKTNGLSNKPYTGSLGSLASPAQTPGQAPGPGQAPLFIQYEPSVLNTLVPQRMPPSFNYSASTGQTNFFPPNAGSPLQQAQPNFGLQGYNSLSAVGFQTLSTSPSPLNIQNISQGFGYKTPPGSDVLGIPMLMPSGNQYRGNNNGNFLKSSVQNSNSNEGSHSPTVSQDSLVSSLLTSGHISGPKNNVRTMQSKMPSNLNQINTYGQGKYNMNYQPSNQDYSMQNVLQRPQMLVANARQMNQMNHGSGNGRFPNPIQRPPVMLQNQQNAMNHKMNQSMGNPRSSSAPLRSSVPITSTKIQGTQSLFSSNSAVPKASSGSLKGSEIINDSKAEKVNDSNNATLSEVSIDSNPQEVESGAPDTPSPEQ